MTKLFEFANEDMGMRQFEFELRVLLEHWLTFLRNEQAPQ